MARDPKLYANTAIKIKRTTLERLQKEADERVIGRNLLIEKFIEQGLENLPPNPYARPKPTDE